MEARNKYLALGAVAAISGLIYGTSAFLQARNNLVTLNVRDMDVRRVVEKIEWQTRENIAVHKGVQGKVTLNVRKMPLEEVLKIVGEQTSSRWSSLYPLYSSGRSLAALQKALRGDAEPASTGWTNLQVRGSGPGAGPGGMSPVRMMGGAFAAPMITSNQLVSLQVFQKDVAFAALALNRFAQARVVPEDGTAAIVNLSLHDASVSDAVATLARKANRSWTKLYTLRGEFGPGGPTRMATRGPNGGEGNGPSAEEREAMRKQREALDEELKQALSEEDRQKLEQAQREREQQRQETASLTPEQRQDRMGQMGSPNMAQRNLERIKNTTPEQRAEQRRKMVQRRSGGPGGQRPPGPR